MLNYFSIITPALSYESEVESICPWFVSDGYYIQLTWRLLSLLFIYPYSLYKFIIFVDSTVASNYL